LFFVALKKGNAAERAAYLDSACGSDTELRRQVERMVRAHPRVGDFFSKPAVEQMSLLSRIKTLRIDEEALRPIPLVK
jgi:hypothetical protein